MRYSATFGVLFACLFSGPSTAFADKLTFENLTGELCCVSVPSGYGGLTWHNFELANKNREETRGSGYDTGAVSGDYTVYNTFGDPAAITGRLFTFASGYFTAAWFNDLNLTIEGWNGSTRLFSTTLILNPSGPKLFEPNWSGINRLAFISSGGVDAGLSGFGTHFVMDDFSYQAAPVPEPSTLLLVGTGIVALARRASKNRRHRTTD
jgi:PEP-CTERM motif